MPDWQIREAQQDDIPAMVSLLTQLFSIEKDFQIDAVKQRLGLELLLSTNSQQSFVLIAELDNDVVAMCSVQVVISTAMGGKAGILEDLIVDEKHRGRGIGKMLLAKVDGWCRTQGVKRLHLLADMDNHKALDFYKQQGWQSTNLCALSRFMFDK